MIFFLQMCSWSCMFITYIGYYKISSKTVFSIHTSDYINNFIVLLKKHHDFQEFN